MSFHSVEHHLTDKSIEYIRRSLCILRANQEPLKEAILRVQLLVYSDFRDFSHDINNIEELKRRNFISVGDLSIIPHIRINRDPSKFSSSLIVEEDCSISIRFEESEERILEKLEPAFLSCWVEFFRRRMKSE